jgi:hypothetical protein
MAFPEKFFLHPSEDSPGVELDHASGVLKFAGRSIPSDAEKIYGPIVSWMKSYAESPSEKTTLVCELDYFNTSSQKYLADIFKQINKLHIEGRAVECFWKYKEDDEDMRQIGEQFEYLFDFPVQYIST